MLDPFLQALADILTQPTLLALSLGGVMLGTILGALPGVSSTMALAILLPVSYPMSPEHAMVFLIAVFSASVFGGSISAILVNIPGTPGAIVTQFDGYPLARAGKAGHALSYALFASTIGGMIGLAILVVVAPIIADAAMSFRSPEFAMATVFGLTMLAYSSPGSTFRGILVGALGLLCGMVGFDALTDVPRFDFGFAFLQSGIDIVPLTVGLFGLAEVMRNLGSRQAGAEGVPAIGSILPPWRSLVRLTRPMLRGSLIGTFIGAIPAAGSAIAVAVAYAQEMRLSKTPERFGRGAPEGIAAPEAANNACVGGALVPMMTLGVPGDTMTAVLMGALLLHGLRPGPLLFAENPGFVGVIYGGLFFAVAATLACNLVLIRAIVQVMRTPMHILMIGIAALSVAGSFAIRNSINDVYIMLFFGLVGYVLGLLRLPAAPMAFGLILGPILEENVRRALIVSRGDWTVFIDRPIALVMLLLSLVALLYPVAAMGWRRLRAARNGTGRTEPLRQTDG
ncbi:putative tricarboxylic transport membrane protein [Tistlia consotensis]|uniref:Putative tricarboxylic transport membrane protein n=1 Tax=Tistlia consotensis USBA 355 TaxID=560819 RepID=A0A1Y6B3T7_9PROT|nr:tripartite tricarboxylate transporter permease [Tistlia consotensis]SME90121.1 putative tricarboxylic transport membrane protein [Tistlia consotensis USBA 355]SNR26567.1 putative tricarboxylic transport membrane protein [Tistlia consotensis]